MDSPNKTHALRVALFTDSDGYAGTERHMLDLARGLKALGDVTVLFVCPSPSPLASGAAAEGLAVVPVPKRGLADPQAVIALRGLLKSGRVNVLHAHNGRTGLIAALAASGTGGACVATQHFLEPDRLSRTGLKGALSHAAHRWVSQKTDHFIAISQAVHDGMRRRGDAPAGRASVVHNGITPPDPAGLAAPGEVRRGLGVGPEAPLIVCAARLEREKDVASLVEAMKAVAAACPAARCVIAGEGAERVALERQIADAGLGGVVTLLGFREDVPSLMRAGDLFVLPSLAEPFGLVILEAMSLHRPVVATRAGGPLEVVAEGETGLLVPPASPDALAAALLGLLRAPKRAAEMGCRGRDRFERDFTAARMALATRRVYETALARRRGRAGAGKAGTDAHA